MAPKGISDPRDWEVTFAEPQIYRETCTPVACARECAYVSDTENELSVSPGPELRGLTPPSTRWLIPAPQPLVSLLERVT